MSRLNARRIWLVRAAILIVALLCVVLGLLRNEHTVVLNKAAGICLECIGIG